MGFYVNKVTDKQLLNFLCPDCGCNQFTRIKRSCYEKALCYLSGGKKATKKYECKNCKWTALLPGAKDRKVSIPYSASKD